MKRLFVFAILSVMLAGVTFSGTPASAATGEVEWNTFYGGSDRDLVTDMTHDSAGNLYAVGWSSASWGTPIRDFSSQNEAFVVKLNPDGELVWHTFLGGAGFDEGFGIAVDKDGNVFAVGSSTESWGTPQNGIRMGGDAFVAKLNPDGTLEWNTFLGGSKFDDARSVGVDAKGKVYVLGRSAATWGVPRFPFAGNQDAFVARLSRNGILNWNTFLGGSGEDGSAAIAVSYAGAAYVTGYSQTTWGNPLRTFADDTDAFVAKVGAHGALKWNTFLGGLWHDMGAGIALDDKEKVYVTGEEATSYTFVAKLGSDGALKWNKNVGTIGICKDLALDSSRNIYLGGYSGSTWGSPVHPYTKEIDGWVARLNPAGNLAWNTFIGGNGGDYQFAIAVDASGKIYAGGESNESWGVPNNPFTASFDAYIAKLQ